MKKFLIFLLPLIMIFSTFCLSACSKSDRYELTSLHGLGVSADFYEYNYIEFNFDDNTYVLENKVKTNNIITKQTGSFIKDAFGGVTITNNDIPSQNYFLYSNETLYFSEDNSLFYASATISGTEIIMIFTKK